MATAFLTDGTFDDTVAGSGIVLVDVWAPWCGPCRRFAPIFEQACAAHPDLVFGKVDADTERGLARRLKLRAIPTLLVYREGGATAPQDRRLVLRQVAAAHRHRPGD